MKKKRYTPAEELKLWEYLRKKVGSKTAREIFNRVTK